eukprot:COSAG02_NODE_14933_length_1222_cov_0.963491_1_plen_359_part_00
MTQQAQAQAQPLAQPQQHTAAARRVSQVTQFNAGAPAASPVRHGGDEPDVAAGSASAAPALQQRTSTASSTSGARRVSHAAQFNTGARSASPVRHGRDDPDGAAGATSTTLSASASVAPAVQQRAITASSTTVKPTAASPVISPIGAHKPSAKLSAQPSSTLDRCWSRTGQSPSPQQQQVPAQQPQPPQLQQDGVPQSAHNTQLPLTLTAVLRQWKEQPHAPMIAKGVLAKLVKIIKTADAPLGLVWKGFTQYSCKVVIASPDHETKAEVFLSDRVIAEFVAQGTTCVELNRRLEAARNSTVEEKAALQQFFKSFPKRFAQMHGRFDIQWQGVESGQPTTYGTVVAFEQQAAPSQQSG